MKLRRCASVNTLRQIIQKLNGREHQKMLRAFLNDSLYLNGGWDNKVGPVKCLAQQQQNRSTTMSPSSTWSSDGKFQMSRENVSVRDSDTWNWIGELPVLKFVKMLVNFFKIRHQLFSDYSSKSTKKSINFLLSKTCNLSN